MIPVIPTDLPNSTVHHITVDTLLTLQTKVTEILSSIQTQLDAQGDKTEIIQKKISEIDEKLVKIIDGDTDFVYQCANGYSTNDEGWDFKPLFRQNLKPRSQKESVVVDLCLLAEYENKWDKNNNLDSADLYNFYLGTQMETVDRRNSMLRKVSPEFFDSFNTTIELRQQSSRYFKVVEPVEIGLNDIQEDAVNSLQLSEKQSVGFSTTLTQSSLISNNSASRSQQLKKRRDIRRKNQSSRQSPVCNLLRGTYSRSRQVITPVSSKSPQNESTTDQDSNLGILDSNLIQNSFTEGMCRSPSWKLLNSSNSGGSSGGNKEPMSLTGRTRSLSKSQIVLLPKKMQQPFSN